VGANTKGAWAEVRRGWTLVLMNDSIHALVISQHTQDRIAEANSARARRAAAKAGSAHREMIVAQPAKRRRWLLHVKPS
jgi:hypothetical protein